VGFVRMVCLDRRGVLQWKYTMVDVCVCMFGHNSGMPGAISTKFGAHIAICMCKNFMYVLCIYIYYIFIS
jgi:hypothetical protein